MPLRYDSPQPTANYYYVLPKGAPPNAVSMFSPHWTGPYYTAPERALPTASAMSPPREARQQALLEQRGLRLQQPPAIGWPALEVACGPQLQQPLPPIGVSSATEGSLTTRTMPSPHPYANANPSPAETAALTPPPASGEGYSEQIFTAGGALGGQVVLVPLTATLPA